MNYDEMNVDTGPELDAVNDILSSIGEPPVTTLDSDTNADVANARRILYRVNRQIQSKGWTFNIETSTTLTPDLLSGRIRFLDSYLSVLTAGGATPYINKEGWLFDRTGNTDLFNGPVLVDMIRLRGFYEMPECYRTWIVTTAARQFNSRFFGAPEIDATLREEVEDARIACQEYELDYGVYNMLDGDTFVSGQLSR